MKVAILRNRFYLFDYRTIKVPDGQDLDDRRWLVPIVKDAWHLIEFCDVEECGHDENPS